MKRNIYLTLVCIIFLLTSTWGQSQEELNQLLRSNQEVPKVLLVGTFHFGYPGYDTHKTNEAYKVDINSPQRQQEVKELVAYITKYKPTKIMVEAGRNTGYLMRRYERWKEGKENLRKREIDQIGFRLMDHFALDTLYGIDANSFARELPRSQDSTFAKPILERIYKSKPDSLFESTFDTKYWEWYDLQDKRCLDMTLLDYFLECNSNHHIDRMHGHYILSDKTTNYDAVDGLILNWYSRNLRIFKNIQMIATSPNDRILILIGSGHVPILRQQFMSSPEYELIDFGKL